MEVDGYRGSGVAAKENLGGFVRLYDDEHARMMVMGIGVDTAQIRAF